MILVRRRLLFWLIKAYIKRWRKTILLCFAIGILLFVGLIVFMPYIVQKIPVGQKQTIGVVGAYTADSLPSEIVSEISGGLTSVTPEGAIKPNAATSWKIQDGGKKYTFTLNPSITFTDGSKLTSANVNYNFSDAKTTKPDKHTVVFTLKDTYAPFLVTVSRPLFKPGFVGIGQYKLQNIKLNGNFIESLTLVSRTNRFASKHYQFYPSFESVKTAYVLGEVSEVQGLPDTTYKNKNFSQFPNTDVSQVVDYSQLVTLFFNTKDSVFSNEKLRNGLSYALPKDFSEGKRTYFPYPPSSWAYPQSLLEKTQDLNHAKQLLDDSQSATKGAQIKVILKTLPKFKTTAEAIVKEWNKVDVSTKIEVVDAIPANYQAFVGDFIVPKDPDQYTLWHSAQNSNITQYANLRIDKLLEDGRKTVDQEKRKEIYNDFQKYLLVDTPAAFLYFPYEYEIARR